MSNHSFRRFFLVVLLLLAAAPPALASQEGPGARGEGRAKTGALLAPRPSPLAPRPAVVLADAWSLGHLFTSGGRTRIVQICVVLMCLALFIMMKKFNG